VGNGFGGVSGPGLLPIGLLAVSRVADALPGVPIIGVGGISRVEHVRDYLRAGASLVAIGTAALADPRLPERLVAQLEQQHG
jgi:dihydroorotate dehydrogenase (NAD+) catalytic subunit